MLYQVNSLFCYIFLQNRTKFPKHLIRFAREACENGFRDGETTGIISIDNGELIIDNDDWYSLDGRKLDGKPTVRGIYINNGKKVVIK